jgi:hypothetical protein
VRVSPHTSEGETRGAMAGADRSRRAARVTADLVDEGGAAKPSGLNQPPKVEDFRCPPPLIPCRLWLGENGPGQARMSFLFNARDPRAGAAGKRGPLARFDPTPGQPPSLP